MPTRARDSEARTRRGTAIFRAGSRSGTPAASISPARSLERAGLEFERKQPRRIRLARYRQAGGQLGREAEPAVVAGVADQQHCAVPAHPRKPDRTLHQRGADAAVAAGRIDRQRTEQQRLMGARPDVPQPDGADRCDRVRSRPVTGRWLGRRPSRSLCDGLVKRTSP